MPTEEYSADNAHHEVCTVSYEMIKDARHFHISCFRRYTVGKGNGILEADNEIVRLLSTHQGGGSGCRVWYHLVSAVNLQQPNIYFTTCIVTTCIWQNSTSHIHSIVNIGS